MSETAEQLAQRVAAQMYDQDTACQALGIVVEAIGPGTSRLAMTVREDMVNGFRICHGGLMFTLADSAFAYACNSRNEATVAAGCSIEFLRPVQVGERLVAIGEERVLNGRSGIYDVTLLDAAGAPVAVFRGKSARVKGEVVAS